MEYVSESASSRHSTFGVRFVSFLYLLSSSFFFSRRRHRLINTTRAARHGAHRSALLFGEISAGINRLRSPSRVDLVRELSRDPRQLIVIDLRLAIFGEIPVPVLQYPSSIPKPKISNQCLTTKTTTWIFIEKLYGLTFFIFWVDKHLFCIVFCNFY